VGVEKLATSISQKLLRVRILDIFYHPIFDFFRKTEFFNSHPCYQQLSEYTKCGSANQMVQSSWNIPMAYGRFSTAFLRSASRSAASL
jgi:hypothetical protein